MVWPKIKATQKYILPSVLFNYRATLGPAVSLWLWCILSGLMSAAPVFVWQGCDLIGPLGRVKSSLFYHSRRSIEEWYYCSCHFRHSAHNTFRLQFKILHGQTSYKSSSLASRSLSQQPGCSGCLRWCHSWWVVKRINTRKHCDPPVS